LSNWARDCHRSTNAVAESDLSEPPSRNARATRSTTRSWSTPAAPPWCRSARGGAMSAPGTRRGGWARKDTGGNALTNVVAEDTANCYLRSEDGLIAAIGVDDLVVVATDDG